MKRWLALLLVLLLCFALTACSKDEDDSTDLEDELKDALGDLGDLDIDLDDGDKGTIGSSADIVIDNSAADKVEAYVESFRSTLEASSTSMMTMSAEARGTEVVYIYQYRSIYDVTDDMSTTIVDSLKAQESTMKIALKAMLQECPSITGISAEYYTAGGECFLTTDMLELYGIN